MRYVMMFCLMLVSTATFAEDESWVYDNIGAYASAFHIDELSMSGVVDGEFFTEEQRVPWWGFYSEKTSEPFLVVGIAVDGEMIVTCDFVKTFCSYRSDPRSNNQSGASLISVTTKQLIQIKDAKMLQFLIYHNDEFVTIDRPMNPSANEALNKLANTKTTRT